METINYEKYLYYKDIEDHLLYLSQKHPDALKLSVLETTDEGRKIYLAEISENVNSEETNEKGGYYVQGSIHANECGGSSAAMHLIDTLLSEKPEVLKNVVFYVVPRVNPDNVELNMLTNAESRSVQTRDLRRKENVIIKKDLDGDGKLLQMRKVNPLGNFKEIAPGVMIPREPGETEGVFYDLYSEGIFENFNDTEAKCAIRNYDFNRCFPCNWMPKPDSAEYPLRHKEVRAVAEFLVTHPNIFAGIDFHNGSNGILRPAMKDDSKMNRADLKLIETIGKLASEITGFPLFHEYMYGGERVMRNGGTNEFFHYNLGVSHYVIELGNGLNDIGVKTDKFQKSGHKYESYLKEIKEYEEENGNPVFYPFKPFEHPQLGPVEIGGEFRGRSYFMNPKNIAPVVKKTTDFILKHAEMGPQLKVSNCEIFELTENVFRIRAQIKNLGVFGTKVIKESTSYQASYPVHIYIEEKDGVEILSRPIVYEIPELSSMENAYVEWFIKCDNVNSITLIADHPKAKTVKIKLDL